MVKTYGTGAAWLEFGPESTVVTPVQVRSRRSGRSAAGSVVCARGGPGGAVLAVPGGGDHLGGRLPTCRRSTDLRLHALGRRVGGAYDGAGRDVSGGARAASRLDEVTVTEAVLRSLQDRGTLTTWNVLLRPVLVAAGEHWQRTGSGIEVEHLLTQAVTTAFGQYIAALPDLPQDARSVTPAILYRYW